MEPTGSLPALEEIPRDECLALLAGAGVGRLAVAFPGTSPLVVPVNFVLDGEAVVFRSGPGTKLRALRGTPVSFEVDDIDAVRHTGWSVLVRGWGYETTRWEIDHLDLTPWLPTDRDHWVRIVPESISGRRIRLPEQFPDLGGYL